MTITPEERAQAISDELVGPGKSISKHKLDTAIATAIREAVEAEREECAKLCKRAASLAGLERQPERIVGLNDAAYLIRCLTLEEAGIRSRGNPTPEAES